MPKSKGEFYAVRGGPSPGVYLTWGECERNGSDLTNGSGIPGARYKKFRTIEEAQAFAGLTPSAGGTDHDHPSIQNASRTNTEGSTSGRNNRGHANLPLRSQRGAPSGTSRKDSVTGQRGRDATVDTVPNDHDDGGVTEVVYTDGACSSNGKANAVAGIGVWWGSGHRLNLSERCPGLQTNNRAEIYAIVRLLEEAPTHERKSRLVIKTDSQYTINCVMDWARKWELKGWMRAPGEKVKNADMIQYLLALLSLRFAQGHPTVLEYVRGHSGNVGNEAADALARAGTVKPVLPERDWLGSKQRVDNAIQALVTSSTFTQKNIKDQFEFVIEEGDLLSFEELEALEKSQDF